MTEKSSRIVTRRKLISPQDITFQGYLSVAPSVQNEVNVFNESEDLTQFMMKTFH